MKDIDPSTEMHRAAFDLKVADTDPDSRLVRLSFSSEEPYMRDGGFEILGHKPGEVDLTRLNSGNAPLLKDHNPALDSMVGFVEKAEIVNGRGQAMVRFSKSEDGDKMLALVRAGEVKCVSVGYRVQASTHVSEREGRPVYRATRWSPYEISLVAVPADDTVGIGRSAGAGKRKNTPSRKKTMTTPTNENTGLSNREQRNHLRAQDHQRAGEIRDIGDRFEMPNHLIEDAVTRGLSTDQFSNIVMDHLGADQVPPTRARATTAALHTQDAQPYSLTRAINAELTGNWSDAGFEKECGDEMRRSIGRAPEGMYVPPVALATRDLLTTANASSLIGTQHMGDAFIESLLPESQVLQLGAMVLSGLQENVTIPRMGAGTQAEWIDEDAEATESTPNFGNVTISLKQLSANSRLSRRQLKQSVPGLDGILKNDMLRQIGVAVDAAAIAGAGTALEPMGILNMPGIGNVEMDTDGGPVTWAKVTELMAAVEGSNIPMGSLGFLSNPKVKSALLSTPKFANGDTAILTADTEKLHIAGTRAAFSTNVPSDLTKGAGAGLSALIFGAWSELLIGQWGGIDIIIDDKSEAAKGNVRIVAHSEWDIAVRHAEAFAAIKDIATS